MSSQQLPDQSLPPERVQAQQSDGLVQRPWLLGAVMFMVIGLIFSLGMAFGYGWGRSVAQAAVTTPFPEATEASDAKSALSPAFDLFWEAMVLLYQYFIGKLPTPEEATYGAIRGVVGLLDDPNTSFLSPDEA